MKETHIMVRNDLQHIQTIFVSKYTLFQMYNILHPPDLNIHHNLFHLCNLDFLVGPAVAHSFSMIRSLFGNSS